MVRIHGTSNTLVGTYIFSIILVASYCSLAQDLFLLHRYSLQPDWWYNWPQRDMHCHNKVCKEGRRQGDSLFQEKPCIVNFVRETKHTNKDNLQHHISGNRGVYGYRYRDRRLYIWDKNYQYRNHITWNNQNKCRDKLYWSMGK